MTVFAGTSVRDDREETAAASARQQAALLITSPADFAVALYGAWEAGLGVLPLPVDFPDERLRHMVGDCRPAALIASADQADRAARLAAVTEPAVEVLVLDALPDGDEHAPRPSPAPARRPGDAPAFTVYTSGSTGRPKGVLIRHGQIGRLVAWCADTWRLGPWARVAQTLSLGFDFGLQELFTFLPFGGCVVVPAREDRLSARAYARFLRREHVSVLFTTPSFADELIAAGEQLPDLRLVLLGGEVLKGVTAEGLRGLAGDGCRLFNGYGPTEATVNCLMYEIPRPPEGEEPPRLVPVGSATAAARIDVVDDEGRAVPVGALGEIRIGGPGVADGYLERPELSAERFVRCRETGELLYRTGDLAYARHDGVFVVVGRADRQTKIRGHRAELGEIEQTLRGAPDVVTAEVRITGTPARLVAYLVGAGIDIGAVRAHVAARLPPAMLPEQEVLLDRMPMTANGKLDEAALERLSEEGHARRLPDTASPAEIEAAVCAVWADALAAPGIAPDANVFDLGAHSLVVTRVHGRISAALGVEFPVHEVFEYPRPRDLARRLAALRRDDRGGPADNLAAATVKDDQ
ncbi:non-ribosomal peptide synthetase [Streptomyces genisteinicus]|uniref:Amino acid adenylation domain-containing protein n=1 Tax=Streptomyces genisteinicus TaxID=2768068 RepID=A0A7H0I1H3_9ACTN|nr:non-ribosomal peptide synthetase [Streptomyces genisteinicus]QNP66639.1 amino acid adenylation domain-containing protein [Streptomyces genisteinicus]